MLTVMGRLIYAWNTTSSHGLRAARLDELIAVINTPIKPPRFWLRHSPLPPEKLTETNRSIPGGPLLDLVELQEAIKAGGFGADNVWIATQKADDDLYKLAWDEERVCDLLCALDASDYHASEWASSSVNSKHPCDAYVIRFDDVTGERDRRGPEYYVKFSLNAAGITICVISCHLSD